MEGLYLKITEDFIPDPKEARFGGKDALIAVEKGDIIFDVKRIGSGWLFGKNLNSGKAGKFPAKCSSDLSGSDNKPKSTIGPFGLRKTEPRKSAEAKEPPTKIAGASETAGNQPKRTVTPRPFKTFGTEPQENVKPVEKDSSGDSGVVTDELAQIHKPVAKTPEKEDASSHSSRALDHLSRGRLRLGQPATDVRQPPSDKNAKQSAGTMEEAKGQVSTDQQKAKSIDVKYGKVAKLPSTDNDQKSHNANKDGAKQLGAAVNVQENPLTKKLEKDTNEGIYQVPNVTLPPPKPLHVLPEGEQVPHEYATPENDYTPSESPAATSKAHKSTKKKADKKQDSKPKQKTQEKKVVKSEKKSSCDSVRLKATEGSKAVAKPVKKTKGRCSTESCPKLKILFGIGLGFTVGVFCFLILYLLFSRHVLTALVVALISGVIISLVLGFLDVTRLKCIVLLIFPSLCSSGAKISLWILLTYFLISGPLCNFIENVRITAQTRGCMMQNRNNSAEGKSMIAKQHTQYLMDNIEQFENQTNELGRYLNETLIQNKTNNRGSLSSRLICMRQLSKAQNTCSLAYESIYNNCTKYLQRWGLRHRCAEFIPQSSGCPQISESFIRTTCESIDSAHLKDLTKITLILQKKPTPVVKLTATNRTGQFSGNLLARKQNLCHCLEIIKVLLMLLILVVLFEAYRYHKHYLVYNEFDNCYLTLHFKSIEDTRRASGANDGLVPLKKSELQKYVQPTSCRLSRVEKKDLFKYLIIFLVYAAFALLLLLGDIFFYQAVTSEEPAALVTTRTALPGCEADLKKPDEVHTIIIPVLLGLLFLLIILQAYVLRLRRYIAARFYRTRERKRVTYLYYKLLEDRKKFFKSTIEKVNSVSEENDTLSRLDAMLVLAHRFPAFGKVIAFLGLSLKRCMVCGTGLHWKYVTCDTEECGAVYCRTCFWDVESNCLGCMTSSKLSSPSWGSTAEAADGKKSSHAKQV